MNKKLVTKENGVIKEYDIILEFTKEDTKKQYVFYSDRNKKEIYMAYYKIENDLYILMPIENKDEIDMCKDILEEIKNTGE